MLGGGGPPLIVSVQSLPTDQPWTTYNNVVALISTAFDSQHVPRAGKWHFWHIVSMILTRECSCTDVFLAFSKAKPKKQYGMLWMRCLGRQIWDFPASSTLAESSRNIPALEGPSCHGLFPANMFERQDGAPTCLSELPVSNSTPSQTTLKSVWALA